jgi:hypothetical protein
MFDLEVKIKHVLKAIQAKGTYPIQGGCYMQISPAYVATVNDEFFEWVRQFDERRREDSFDLLQDYIVTWLYVNSGVRTSGGDYANFLLAVLIIMDAYTKDPSLLDYNPDYGERRERRVKGLLDLDHGIACHLDRHKYQEEVFRRLLDRVK